MDSSHIVAAIVGLIGGGALSFNLGRWYESTTRAWAAARTARRSVKPLYRNAWLMTRPAITIAVTTLAIAATAITIAMKTG